MSPEEVERIAKGLAKAQRSLFNACWPLPANALYGDRLHRYPVVAAGRRLQSTLALWRRGFVHTRDPEEGTGPDAWECDRMGFMRLTPLGLAVRTHIIQETSNG